MVESNCPSHALTVNASKIPYASAAGVHTRLSLLDKIAVPALTAVPPFVSVPELTDSIRKLRESPSTSAAFAAADSIA